MPIRLDQSETSVKCYLNGLVARMAALPEDSGGRLAVLLANLPSDYREPFRRCRVARSIFVRSGTIHVVTMSGTLELQAGDLVSLPAGVLTKVSTSDNAPAECVLSFCVASPDAKLPSSSQLKRDILEALALEPSNEEKPSENSENEPLRQSVTNGKAIWLAGDTYTILLDGPATDGNQTIVHFHIPPGGGPVPHIHTRDFEAFVILSGEVELYGDGAIVTGKPGDVAVLPTDLPHCFKNRTDQNAEMLAILSPAGFDEFIQQAGQVAVPDQQAPAVSDDEKRRLIEIAPKFGVVLRPDIKF